MSVRKNQRGKSNMQFLDTARNINVAVRKLVSRLPKRYTFLGGTELVRLAADVHHNLKGANSVYPTNQHEFQIRRDYLIHANASLQMLLDELDILYNYYADDSLQKCILTIVGMLKLEATLIRGLKVTDKKRFKNFGFDLENVHLIPATATTSVL